MTTSIEQPSTCVCVVGAITDLHTTPKPQDVGTDAHTPFVVWQRITCFPFRPPADASSSLLVLAMNLFRRPPWPPVPVLKKTSRTYALFEVRHLLQVSVAELVLEVAHSLPQQRALPVFAVVLWDHGTRGTRIARQSGQNCPPLGVQLHRIHAGQPELCGKEQRAFKDPLFVDITQAWSTL
jgi:hypothetical protein